MYISYQEKKYTITIVGLLCVLYLAHKIMPIVGAYMPGIIYALLFFLVALKIKPVWLRGSMIPSETVSVLPLLSITALDLLVKYFLNRNITGAVFFLYGEAQIFLFTLIGLYYICYCSLAQRKKLLRIILGMYLVTAVTTAVGCKMFPQAARILATTISTNSPLYQLYTRNNIGGFTFTYELVLLTPLFIYLMKTKRINVFVGIAALIIIGLEVVFSEYTTALLIFLVCLSLLFMGKLTKQKIEILVIALLLLLTVGKSLIAMLLSFIAEHSDSLFISSRLEYLAATLSGVEYADVEAGGDRISLYLKTIQIIFSTFFLGTWFVNRSGGHSYVLDYISVYGVVGIAAIYVQYRCIFNLYIRSNKKNDFYYYSLWTFFMGIILAVVNTKPFFSIFTVVIALMGSIIEEERVEELT